MTRLHYSVDIDAPRQRVWEVLWDDRTYRDWASAFMGGVACRQRLEGGEQDSVPRLERQRHVGSHREEGAQRANDFPAPRRNH